MKKIIIFGNGEIAKLAHFYFENDPQSKYKVVAFTIDDEYIESKTFNKLPLIPSSKLQALYPPNVFSAHVALSYKKLNQLRQEKYDFMKSLGYELISYVCSKSVFWDDLNIGDNCFILENQTIQPTVTIGNNVMIWSTNHLGHNCKIEDHVYLASGIIVSGHTKIGERTFVGVNSSFKDFINIGSDCFITMGVNLTKNVPDGCTVIGGDFFDSNSMKNKILKQKYFDLKFN